MLPRTGRFRFLRRTLSLLFLVSYVSPFATGAPSVRVAAQVSSNHVELGGSLQLEIRVYGSDKPKRPTVSETGGFSVSYGGGSINDSTSITVINGNETTKVRKGYVYSYTLTPTRTGPLTIPSIPVTVNGRTYNTHPIDVRVTRPKKTSAFLLDLKLSRGSTYVGDPVVLTVDWYISRDVSSAKFNLPMLYDPAFRTKSLPMTPNGGSLLQMSVGSAAVTARRTSAVEKGRTYTLIEFRKLLIPRKAGDYHYSDSSVDLVAQQPSGSLFSSFFGTPASQQDWVIPGSVIGLKVKRLPASGRPPDFTGLVGAYKLQVSATPTTVNVGDPITLTVKLTGGTDIADANIPPIRAMAGFAAAFTFPSQRSAGTVHGSSETFTQTIRAKSDKVTEIPPVVVPYFDPSSRRYRILRSSPISLVVHRTRIVTAKDLQGRASVGAVRRQASLRTLSGGIEYNYEGRDVLARRPYSPAGVLARPAVLGAGGAPLAAFLLLFGVTRLRRRAGSGRSGRKREAARELYRACDSGSGAAEVFSAFRRYLGLRLGLDARNPGYEQLRGRLGNGEFDRRLGELFALYDECRFARSGEVGPAELGERLAKGCRNVVIELEGRRDL